MAEDGELAPGWTEHFNPEGIPYYYNAETGQSVWVKPVIARPGQKRAGGGEGEDAKKIRLDGEDEDEEDEVTSESVSPDRQRAILNARKIRISETLSSSDQILDPNVIKVLKEWITTSDTLATLDKASKENLVSSCANQAAKLLAEGYDGCGDQATLLGEWIDLIAGPGTALKLASNRVRSMAASSSTIVTKLNDVLSEYENPPQWLLGLLPSAEWRSLFLDLAAKNPSSPFLNFCVRFIAETGHHEEVAQSVTSSQFFSVFERSLGDTLVQLIDACQGDATKRESVGSLVNRIVQLAETCSHASLYCGQVLFDMEKRSDIEQKTRFVLAHVRQRVQHFRNKLLHRGGLRTDCPQLATCLSRVMSGDLDACESCEEIYRCYTSEPVPPIWPLLERDFLDRLTSGLFRPAKKMDDNIRKKACWVLAKAALCPQDEAAPQSDNEQIEKLSQKIETCSKICNDVDTIGAVEAKWRTDLQPLCEEHPTCSIGVLFWARALLAHHDFLVSSSFPLGFVTICKIAQMASTKHPLQRPHAFAVLKRALDTRPPAEEEALVGGTYLSDARLAELAENVIDSMVDLMSKGFVLPVLDHFIQHAPSLDLSLLRKFLVGALEISEAPYSKTFKDKLLTLLQSAPGLRAGQGGGSEFERLKTHFLGGAVRI